MLLEAAAVNFSCSNGTTDNNSNDSQETDGTENDNQDESDCYGYKYCLLG